MCAQNWFCAILPPAYQTPILTPSQMLMIQEKRIEKEIQGLERDKGVKLRVLAQNYPNTPGACQLHCLPDMLSRLRKLPLDALIKQVICIWQ